MCKGLIVKWLRHDVFTVIRGGSKPPEAINTLNILMYNLYIKCGLM